MRQVKSTGRPLDLDDDEHCSVVMATETMKVRVEGKFRQRERKLMILLIHSVWDDIGRKRIHEVDIELVKQVFRDIAGVQSFNSWLYEYLGNLANVLITIEQGKSYEWISLFASIGFDDDQQKVHFEIPKRIETILKNPSQFARLDTYFVIGLKGKYSVSLYQFLESKVNMWKFDPTKTPEEQERFFLVELDELRKWMGIDSQYKLWGDFNRFALTPAVEEINSNPIASTFTVRTAVVRGARNKVKAIKFFLAKTPERLRIEKKIKTTKQSRDNAVESLVPPFSGTAIYEKAKAISNGLDVYILEKEWRAYAREMNEPVKDPERAFLGFVKIRARSR
ncbi:MAG: replication initiation protein [Verrucomicrobiota bacterium]